MKKLLIAGLLLMLGFVALAQTPKQVSNFHYHGITFSNFAAEVFKTTGVKIYYKADLVAKINVSIDADSVTVTEAIARVIAGSGLSVSEWEGALVLLPGPELLTQLPDYKAAQAPVDSVQATDHSLTETEERYLSSKMAGSIKTIHVGSKGGKITGSKARLLGRVLDSETGEPVFYATLYVQETRGGAVSDQNGYFSLMLAPGKYNATIEFLGYQKSRYLLDVLSDGEFTVRITKAIIQMKEFVVHGDRQSSIKAKDPGLDKISMRAIKALPTMMGERDILKVSGTLPGIVSTGEGTSGLNVRGGSSDQNAFYINKIPVYNTAHLFGFFPAFNSDIIRDFSIYKGHIPAQYGGRLSSVFNIVTRQGNRRRFTMRGGVSPVTANLVVESPVVKDKASIILSARSSYSDWILTRIKDTDIRSSSAGFYDVSGGFNADIRKSQIAAFFYKSQDHFRLSDLNDYTYSNSGMSFSVGQVFSNSLRGEFSVVAAEYSFSNKNTIETSKAYSHAYALNHYEFRADFKHVISDVHTFDYGIGSTLYKLRRGIVEPLGINSVLKKVDLGNEQGIENGIYFSDAYEMFSGITLTGGVRFSVFNPLGPKMVYEYTEGLPVDPRYISDSIFFADNIAIRNYLQPDIRLALNIETDLDGSVKLAFNQMHQNLFMLNNTSSIAPDAQWKLADYHIKPSQSNQVSAGVFRVFPQNGLEASVEAYYKLTDNFPEFKDGADFLASPLVETVVLQGKQKAWGIEWFVKRSGRKLEGWLSYTFSRSHVQVSGPNAWFQINNGKSYPANFDIPHALNLVLNYHLTRRVTFSGVVTYQKGRPITYPVAVYYVDGVPAMDYSERNAYRIPDYFRTDLSLTVEGNLKKKKPLHSSLVISVYNLTGRQNPYSVYFTSENGRITSYKYSVIGVPVLTATWMFKLGNYATE